MERPKLPAPHQVVSELYRLVLATAPTSKRSLVYHGAITLEETLIGFLIGATLGIGLAVDHRVDALARAVDDALDRRLADGPHHRARADDRRHSQPVRHHRRRAQGGDRRLFVVLPDHGRNGERASARPIRCSSTSCAPIRRRPLQTFVKLRAPASAPFFFASMKIAAAAALVGAVVAEVTKSEDGGLGARLLAGSYYGQTVQIWAALFAAAALSAALVGAHRPRRTRRPSIAWGLPDDDDRAPLADLLPRSPSASLFWRYGRPACGSRTCREIILPAPSAIAVRFVTSVPTLAADFWQTIQGVLAGYAIGCACRASSSLFSIDRSQFLQRGLLPLGNLVSALPIVGVAPIMVMWFGFDWQSKAAVVVVMTFFPMLVNAVAGLASAGAMERDLMKTYAARLLADAARSCVCPPPCPSSSMR